MAVEPEFPYGMGPGSVSSTVGIVSEEIERYYQSKDEEPERSDLDEDFWILGVADEDVPPIYRFPKPYAVYTLRCDNSHPRVVQERANEHNLDVSYNYLMSYYHNRGIVDYVGYTQNPYRRMSEHFDRWTKAAKFTTLHPPIRLSQIKWCESEDKAENLEEYQARKLQRLGSFVNLSPFSDED